MLVLSRKIKEVIKIDESIEISVIKIGKDYVRLGITAPEDMMIIRDDAINKECPDKKTSMNVMGEVAELLLEIAAGTFSRQQARQAMKKVEGLMRKYADLKVAEKKSASCCGKCSGVCGGGCNHD